MIFPDKPRPPWQHAKPKLSAGKISQVVLPAGKPKPEPKPPGYYRERIELAAIVIGMYFWIQYWIQYQ